MALISASRMNDLKARVKAECQKRSKTGDASGSASVSSYGGTSYDFSTKPAQGVKITKEHNTKNATPLNAINANVVTSSIVNATSVSDSGLTTMEAFVTTLETR